MKRKRFVLEGEWTGYRPSQRRIAHRTITYAPERYKDLRIITYTDGTGLVLTVRECKPREKVQEIHGYDSLIAECLAYGTSRVEDLPPCCRNCHRKATALVEMVGPLGTSTGRDWLCSSCQDKLRAENCSLRVITEARKPL